MLVILMVKLGLIFPHIKVGVQAQGRSHDYSIFRYYTGKCFDVSVLYKHDQHYCPSVLVHCWLGHLTRKNRPHAV